MRATLDHREAFHLFFLQKLFTVSDPALYALKGGVNLRFFFHSPRYSEDMDLDVFAGSVSTLKKNGYKVLEDKAFRRALQVFGIRDLEINDPAKAKQTSTTQRFRLRLVTEAGIVLPTKVEFSRRDAATEEVVIDTISGEIARQYGRLAFSCRHYSGNAAFLQKIRALAGRDTPQCRDVFDLYILKLAGYGSKDLISKKITHETITKAVEIIHQLEFQDFQGQVVEFLEEHEKTRLGTDAAWDLMRWEVLEVLSHA